MHSHHHPVNGVNGVAEGKLIQDLLSDIREELHLTQSITAPWLLGYEGEEG